MIAVTKRATPRSPVIILMNSGYPVDTVMTMLATVAINNALFILIFSFHCAII